MRFVEVMQCRKLQRELKRDLEWRGSVGWYICFVPFVLRAPGWNG
jgi:hypothetical protein